MSAVSARISLDTPVDDGLTRRSKEETHIVKRSTLIMILLAAVGTSGCPKPSPTLSSVSITGLPSNLVPPQTVQLTATANYSDNSLKDVTTSATWSSSNTNIATVSGGVVTAKAAGPPVSISCTFEGKSAAVNLNVTGAMVMANPGGPYRVIHNTDVTLDGRASTSSPFPIVKYTWNCGQSIQINCDRDNDSRPVFKYRKCFVAPGIPLCNSGSNSTGVATYTVRLTVTDSQGNSDTKTTTITVQNQY